MLLLLPVRSPCLHSTFSCHVILTLSHPHTLPLISSHPHTHTRSHIHVQFDMRAKQTQLRDLTRKAGTSPTPSHSPPHIASHQHIHCLPGVTPFHLMSLGHTTFLSTGNFGNTSWYCELFSRFSNQSLSICVFARW